MIFIILLIAAAFVVFCAYAQNTPTQDQKDVALILVNRDIPYISPYRAYADEEYETASRAIRDFRQKVHAQITNPAERAAYIHWLDHKEWAISRSRKLKRDEARKTQMAETFTRIK